MDKTREKSCTFGRRASQMQSHNDNQPLECQRSQANYEWWNY